jgi:SAM-dependent methyltransferase
MLDKFAGPCPVCSGLSFKESKVLWPDLINTWQLSEHEIAYINRQQGFSCSNCSNNLRAMGLAKAILRSTEFAGSLQEFCSRQGDLAVLEINRAGNLTRFLEKLTRHKLVEFPEFDMLNLNVKNESYDIVLHSDTLEHVPDPLRGLSECRRVLRDGGLCIFTIPIIIDRMTRSRVGLPASYHGSSQVPADDQVVRTEFGVDMWKTVLSAGFVSCEIFAFEYPAALALIARK